MPIVAFSSTLQLRKLKIQYCNFLSNISTKNYRHRLQFDEVITKTTKSTFTQSQCIFTSRLNAANTIIAIAKFASIIASRKNGLNYAMDLPLTYSLLGSLCIFTEYVVKRKTSASQNMFLNVDYYISIL